MKLSDMIDLLEKLKSQDGDIEITEISVELNESRTTTIPMKAYANALKSKKADTGGFCLYFYNAPTVWQIYEEPEPQYKVGDWIEFIDAGGRKLQGEYRADAYDNAIFVLNTTYNRSYVVPMTKIIRKLSPADMVIHIGCLSGTVEKSPFPKFEFILATEAGGCRILFDALDTQTRELVESLLRAQKEEEE